MFYLPLPARMTGSYGRAGSSIMKYTVYVLKDRDGKVYKGMTSNLTRRLYEHRNGYTVTTSRMYDIRVVYTEEYDTFEEARRREKYFKTSTGRKFLKFKI